jgi:hypothetical protein
MSAGGGTFPDGAALDRARRRAGPEASIIINASSSFHYNFSGLTLHFPFREFRNWYFYFIGFSTPIQLPTFC